MISQDDLQFVCEQCGVSGEILMTWIEEQLISFNNLRDDEVLDTVRRVRRLTTLGVNLPGVDMILHMRRQLIEHRERIQRIEMEMQRLQLEHEREITRLLRQLTSEV